MTKLETLIKKVHEISINGYKRQDAYGNAKPEDSRFIGEAAMKLAKVCEVMMKALEIIAMPTTQKGFDEQVDMLEAKNALEEIKRILEE